MYNFFGDAQKSVATYQKMYNFFGDAQKSVATYQSLLYICKQNKTPDI